LWLPSGSAQGGKIYNTDLLVSILHYTFEINLAFLEIAALSIGSKTWTINKRDVHKGKGTNEIFKTATQTDNKGQTKCTTRNKLKTDNVVEDMKA
jgi:hypothetical protein